MMRCEQARVLIGVHDELDAPARQALKTHVETCRACTEVWLEETEFRRLMAARPAPAPMPRLEARLLAVPARDLGIVRLRAQFARFGPPTLLAFALALGALWTVHFVRGPNDRMDRSRLAAEQAAGAGPSAAALGPGAPPPATAVARRYPVAVRGAGTVPGVTNPSGDRESLPGGDPSRLPAPFPGVAIASPLEPVALAGAASDIRSTAVPATVPAVEPPRVTPRDGRDPRGERSGLPSPMPPATANPVTAPPPTSAPPASPTAAAWQLRLTVRVDDPSADLTGAGVVVQIEAPSDGGLSTVYEEPLNFTGRVAEDSPRLAVPPPYEVELFAALPGLALCAGESRARTVDAGNLVDGRGELVFRLCPEPTPEPPTPPDPTPVAGSPTPMPAATVSATAPLPMPAATRSATAPPPAPSGVPDGGP